MKEKLAELTSKKDHYRVNLGPFELVVEVKDS
jgi:hypothetical protein